MTDQLAARCPACEGVVELAGPYLGQQTECPDCGALYEVVSLEPLELAYALSGDDDIVLDDEPGA